MTVYESMSPFKDEVLQKDGSLISLINGEVNAGPDEGRAMAYQSMQPMADKILLEDGTVTTWLDKMGGSGGETGPQGPTGPKGESGATGPQGPQGEYPAPIKVLDENDLLTVSLANMGVFCYVPEEE